MIMREGSIMLVSGIAIGLLLAIATARILSGILYGVGALDPDRIHGCSTSSRYRRAHCHLVTRAARNTAEPDCKHYAHRVNYYDPPP